MIIPSVFLGYLGVSVTDGSKVITREHIASRNFAIWASYVIRTSDIDSASPRGDLRTVVLWNISLKFEVEEMFVVVRDSQKVCHDAKNIATTSTFDPLNP